MKVNRTRFLIVFVTMLMFVVGLSSNSIFAAKNSKLDPVTLKIMIPGDRPAHMDNVIAEAEKRMAGNLNVKLNVVFIPWSDLAQKTQVTLASGEDIDLIFDAPWCHINQSIAAGYYEPLDGLLAKYGKNILNTREKQMWDANKFNGKIMGIPLGNAHKAGVTYYVRKDIREKLGVAPIKSYDDLIKFAYTVKSKEPNVIPLMAMGQDSQKGMSEASYRHYWDYDTHIDMTPALPMSLVLYFKNNDGKVYNMFDQKESKIWGWIENSRKLYQDKIIHQDILAIKDMDSVIKSGKVAIGVANDFGVKSDFNAALKKNVPGAEFEAVTFFSETPGKNITNFKQWNFLCVPTVSKHKERAIQFLNWANQKDNYDLLGYGIKGVDWEPVGKDQYKPLSDKYTWFPYAWIWNTSYDRFNASQDAQTLRLNKFCKVASNFKSDILIGFNFDATPITNEITQYNAIEAKYYTAIFNGVVDPDESWKSFKDEAAPVLKKIQIELQRQINKFLKAKK